jgi:hypothetical protein
MLFLSVADKQNKGAQTGDLLIDDDSHGTGMVVILSGLIALLNM